MRKRLSRYSSGKMSAPTGNGRSDGAHACVKAPCPIDIDHLQAAGLGALADLGSLGLDPTATTKS